MGFLYNINATRDSDYMCETVRDDSILFTVYSTDDTGNANELAIHAYYSSIPALRGVQFVVINLLTKDILHRFTTKDINCLPLLHNYLNYCEDYLANCIQNYNTEWVIPTDTLGATPVINYVNTCETREFLELLGLKANNMYGNVFKKYSGYDCECIVEYVNNNKSASVFIAPEIDEYGIPEFKLYINEFYDGDWHEVSEMLVPYEYVTSTPEVLVSYLTTLI